MEVIERLDALRARVARARAEGARIGFVPTMGYLHAGHQALIVEAKRRCGFAVVSVFVNPTQFGPGEDLERYPRDLARDRARCEAAGADALFVPDAATVYPNLPNATWVRVGGLSAGLCGRARPDHFEGVATVVSRLFNMVQPDVACFGEKDYQQLAIIRRMVEDLAFPIEVVGVATVREADGLAMSSRNAYLSPAARAQAVCLRAAIEAARAAYAAGERDAQALLARAREAVAARPLASLDYAELVSPRSLRPLQGQVEGPALLALAVRFEGARLIDNGRIDVAAPPGGDGPGAE